MSDLLALVYGQRMRTESVDTRYAVGTAVTRILPFNPRRIAWYINPGQNNVGTVTVRRDNTVSSTDGFTSNNLAFVLPSWLEWGSAITEELWAIGTNAADTVEVREILLT